MTLESELQNAGPALRPKRKYKKRRRKPRDGWERSYTVSGKVPWLIYQKLRYIERHGKPFPFKPHQIVSGALRLWLEQNPEFTEGFKPDRSLEAPRRSRDGYVYLFRAETGLFKIGRTQDVRRRLIGVRTQERCEIECIHLIEAEDSYAAEVAAHRMFKHRHERGEWFKLTPADVRRFKSLTADSLCGQGGAK